MREFETKAEACDALAHSMASILAERLNEDEDRARLLLSGGSTPAPAYEALAGQPVDWSRVDVGLVDDRWVEETDAASNARLVRAHFLAKGAAAASFFPMKTEHTTPQRGVPDANVLYARFAVPDIAVIGMGPDGHTASWFPDSKGLDAAMSPTAERVVEAIDATGCPVAGDLAARMTVTLPVLVQARHIFLLITGDEKRRVFESTNKNLPIHTLLSARQGRMEVYWAP